MQLHTIQPIHRQYPRSRVGRGGKRGTTAGRGTKGQKARAGHRIRPAERDIILRFPKLRGSKNKSFRPKLPVINVGDLEKRGRLPDYPVKILGKGELKKSFHIKGLAVSKGAREKIIAAGGTVQ